MARLLPALLLSLAALLAGACDLPQNQGSGSSDSGSDSGSSNGSSGSTTWRLLQIADHSGADPSSLPGADIDAIVAFRDGEFLFAGCATASLFDQDDALYPVNAHDDVDDATLAVREDGAGEGFLSLAGGVLICELPLDLVTGDTVLVVELESDGAETWQAMVAESGASSYVAVGDPVDGVAEITLP